jgi:hypothetical protein
VLKGGEVGQTDRGGEPVVRGKARGELGHWDDVPHVGAGEHDHVWRRIPLPWYVNDRALPHVCL